MPPSSGGVFGLSPLAAVAAAALAASGCSLSYNLGSMEGRADIRPRPAAAAPGSAEPDAASEVTGAGGKISADTAPDDDDLAHARIAVARAFSKGVSTQSTAWENPSTGARGTITPIRAAYRQEDGGICRDFLASHVRDGDETWLEGAACRGRGGRWTVKRLTPWKQA